MDVTAFGKLILITALLYNSCSLTVEAQKDIRILSFNGDNGFVHDSKPSAERMIKELCARNNWIFTSSSDPAIFTDPKLSDFDLVVFSNNCGTKEPVFKNVDQQKGLQQFIRSGKGFVGIHCAGALWHETGEFKQWYENLVGTAMIAHPAVQEANLIVENRSHVSTIHLPIEWKVTDEWHQFNSNPRKRVNVLISLDESSYHGNEKMNGDHPVAWYHEYDGGRAFFTTLGHTIEIYEDENYRKLIEGGIQWTAKLAVTYNVEPIKKNLILDLNADKGLVIEDGDRVSKWTNQVPSSPVKDFVKRDAGRYVSGSGRPGLKLMVPEIRGHNTLIFHRQELVNHQEDAFDHMLTGTGYTWFIILTPYIQVPGLKDVSSFFGNLRNSGNYEGIWGNLTDDNRVWMGSRSGKTFGRWDENNPMILSNDTLEIGRYYLIMGRMGEGRKQVPIELFINDPSVPAASGQYPVNWTSNPSKMVIGQERDATNHPGTESFDGEIARFLIYDRPLSDEEMKVMADKLLLDYHITIK